VETEDIREAIEKVEREHEAMTQDQRKAAAQRALDDLGITQEHLAEFEFMKKCYEEAATGDQLPPEMLKVSRNGLRLFESYMQAEAVSHGEIKDLESFTFGIIMGLCIGAEMVERRHA
jgi:hypothetical protein